MSDEQPQPTIEDVAMLLLGRVAVACKEWKAADAERYANAYGSLMAAESMRRNDELNRLRELHLQELRKEGKT